MKNILLLPLLFLSACGMQGGKTANNTEDSLTRALKEEEKMWNRIYWDTANIAAAPIKVIEATVAGEEEFKREAILKFQNVSQKTVDAVRLSYYEVNAYGEPTSTGSGSYYSRGHGSLSYEIPLPPNEIATAKAIPGFGARKIAKAWPTTVVFSDGSKWEATSN